LRRVCTGEGVSISDVLFEGEDGTEQAFGRDLVWSNHGDVPACFDGANKSRTDHAIEKAANASRFSIQGNSDLGR